MRIIEAEGSLTEALTIPISEVVERAAAIKEALASGIIDSEQAYTIIEKGLEIPKPKEVDTKLEYYSQFTPRELAYIVNYGEITDKEAMEALTYKTNNNLILFISFKSEYEQYANKDTAFSSEGILAIPETYKDWTMQDFAAANEKDEPFWRHDRCIYVMKKLEIYDYDKWSSLTGYKGKGSRFMDEVGKNIGGLVAGAGKIIGDIFGDVFSGLAEGILGKDWKLKLGIGIAIVIILLVVVGVGYFYLKSYVGQKAIKKVSE